MSYIYICNKLKKRTLTLLVAAAVLCGLSAAVGCASEGENPAGGTETVLSETGAQTGDGGDVLTEDGTLPDEPASQSPTEDTDAETGTDSAGTGAPLELPTDAPAESSIAGTDGDMTVPNTETEIGTEPRTEAPTEARTEAPTEARTEAPTEARTEAPTERETQGEVLTLPPEETAPPFEPETYDPSDVAAEVMPRIDIITEGGREANSKEEYVSCTVTMSECAEEYAFTSLPAGLRLRGNSTAGGAKKPYRLKFESKIGMLGLNDGHKFKTWVLMADYFDSSMLRTYGTFRMADVLLDDIVYSSDCAHVEVYINGDYRGVYLLCEQTQIKKNRVGIDELDDGDTSVEQGYLLIGQGGRYDEPGNIQIPVNITVRDRNGATSHYGTLNFALSSGDYTDVQKAYCSTYLGGVCRVIDAAIYRNEYYALSRDGSLTPLDFPDGMTEDEKQIETVSRVFNIESCVRLCILDEIVKNLDAMTFNMYVDLSPEGDGRLTLAAPWDFDFCMANTKYDTLHSPLGWYATNLSRSDGVRVNFFYVLFGSVGWFDDMVREVWADKYPALHEEVKNLLIESARYDEAFTRDWSKWGRPTAGTFGHHDMRDLMKMDSHMDSAFFVYDWLYWRLLWLNAQWGDGVFDESAYEDSRYAQDEKPDPNAQPVFIDMTKSENEKFLSGFGYCEGTITENGLHVTLLKAYDPQFYLDVERGGLSLQAKDYPYLYITFRVPDSNPTDSYLTELFLCAGSFSHAVGGVSTSFHIEKTGDNYVTVKVDLRSSGYWSGDIHRIRVDYFSSCADGDEIWIKSFEFSNK